MSLRQQIAGADVVARAGIVDAESSVTLEDPPLRRPTVDAVLMEVLKGDLQPGRVRFAQHGHGVAKFVDGEEVLLFLRRIERSAELRDSRLAALVSWVSVQEHDARLPLSGASGERIVSATRAYLAVEAIRDPKTRLAAQQQLTREMLLSEDRRLAVSALQDLVLHEDLELVTRADLPALFQQIRDPAAPIGLRVGLLAELERRGLVVGSELWVQLLRETRGADRSAAIRAAGRHPSPAVTAELVRILEGGDAPAARVAAVALGSPGNATATAPLARALASEDARLRMSAIRGLGRIATPAARRALESTAAGHPDKETRRRARAEADLLKRGRPSTADRSR